MPAPRTVSTAQHRDDNPARGSSTAGGANLSRVSKKLIAPTPCPGRVSGSTSGTDSGSTNANTSASTIVDVSLFDAKTKDALSTDAGLLSMIAYKPKKRVVQDPATLSDMLRNINPDLSPDEAAAEIEALIADDSPITETTLKEKLRLIERMRRNWVEFCDRKAPDQEPFAIPLIKSTVGCFLRLMVKVTRGNLGHKHCAQSTLIKHGAILKLMFSRNIDADSPTEGRRILHRSGIVEIITEKVKGRM